MERILKQMAIESRDFPIIGWNEWASLPDLKVPLIRCKVDTGARTSALHAFYIEEFTDNGVRRVRFGLHPEQDNTDTEVHCIADVVDVRRVTDSGGHSEQRVVIQTQVVLGSASWPIEITLTNRDTMRFRMLLGRTAIADNYIVDPGAAYLLDKPSTEPVLQPLVSRRHDEEE